METEETEKKRILLIVGGGVAAYRALDVVRLLKKAGFLPIPVMTHAAKEFITPLSLASLSGENVHDSLFSPVRQEDRQQVNGQGAIEHIALARSADLVLVCPATANLIARMAHGLADDLATTLLLATTAPVVIAPAMNVRMWEHPAMQENLAKLKARSVQCIGPDQGEMACGEYGLGRLAQPDVIVDFVQHCLKRAEAGHPLSGRKILVTAGPTREAIDPVRYISNYSSGRQGFAIAEALSALGAEIILVSGPTEDKPPSNLRVQTVNTACEMEAACLACLDGTVSAAICVAAVSDWRPAEVAMEKIKKDSNAPPLLHFVENPDILARISHHDKRPSLVIGFAAETGNILENAREKRKRKGCDWILANDVSPRKTDVEKGDKKRGQSVFGSDYNQICLLTEQEETIWPEMSKTMLACQLAEKIGQFFQSSSQADNHETDVRGE